MNENSIKVALVNIYGYYPSGEPDCMITWNGLNLKLNWKPSINYILMLILKQGSTVHIVYSAAHLHLDEKKVQV